MSEDTDDVLAIILCARKRTRKRHRRISVHEILQKSHIHGEYHHLVKELHLYPDKFHAYFGMTEEQFEYVLKLIEDDIRKEDNNCRKAITQRERLAICLRFLSTGDSFKTIGFSYHIGVATVSGIVRDVSESIWGHLQPICLAVSSTNQWRQTAQGFMERWQFPNCIGALDGKHILNQAPPNSGSTYFNYKKSFSMVLMALVDHAYCFTVVDIGSYGSNSDAGIFRKSTLYRSLENYTLGVPEYQPLHNAEDRGHIPHVIVGDEAFPLMRNIMRSHPGTRLDDAKRIFNYRLSRARRIVENAFGILASRWRMYHRKIPLSADNVQAVVNATIVLHNMLQRGHGIGARGMPDEERQIPEDDINGGILRPIRRFGHRPQNEPLRLRDALKDYLVSPQGAVVWKTDAYK